MPELTRGVDLSDLLERVVVVNDAGKLPARAVAWLQGGQCVAREDYRRYGGLEAEVAARAPA